MSTPLARRPNFQRIVAIGLIAAGMLWIFAAHNITSLERWGLGFAWFALGIAAWALSRRKTSR